MSILERTRLIVGTEPSRALRFLPATILVIDVFAVTLAGMLATIGRERLTVFTPASGIDERLGVVGPLAIVAWVAIIALAGGYRRSALGAGTDEFKRVVNASLMTGGVLGVGCFLAKYDFSRGFFLLAFVIGPVLLVVGRMVVRKVLHNARRRGHLRLRVLVAGSPARVDEVTQVLRREPWLGYSVIGAVAPAGTAVEETATGIPVFGDKEDVVEIGLQHQADLIFFAGGGDTSAETMREYMWELEKHKVEVVIAPTLSDISQERVTMRPIGGLPLIHVDRPTWAKAGKLGKRLFDLIGSSLLILALAPILVFTAVRVRAHDRGPILFRQTRIGRGGVEFSCLKFRTMVVDAEERLASLIAQTKQEDGLFKMVDDPRITKPGKWLRRFSIDELPQLFNVFRGEMSLVGPRPPLPREVATYDSPTARRLHVRPGMTGLWQVSGRSDLPWEEAIRLDRFYVDNWSMLQDISILFRTVGAVFSSRGAY